MQRLAQLDSSALKMQKVQLEKIHMEYCSQGLSLNMMRGVPSPEQLSLANSILSCLSESDYLTETGVDCRSYGVLDGIPEMKRIFADLLDVSPDEVIVGGNSSLNMMFDSIASNMINGTRNGKPWAQQENVKFLCPSPGYDRHFAICEHFNIEMIPIEMKDDGPDMDKIEELVSSDPMIKGIWCVPKYSNPTGVVYSDEIVRRFANLKPAAADFQIYWDNAYVIHHLTDENIQILNIIRECEKAGNPDMPLVFTSFSKISYAGAAVSCLATSKANCDHIRKRLTIQTIGPDKINQLRHVRFFKDIQGIYDHMEKIKKIMKPKFDMVENTLKSELAGLGIADWSTPKGGYFVSFNALPNCAKKIVSRCKEAGVSLTPAGATYPYGKDPEDRNIRIAPSFPSLSELELALKVFCNVVKLVSVEKLLEE